MTKLSPRDANHITTVSGIGGVGKTALVLECAYRCLEGRRDRLANQPQFEAIIFTSAKQEYLNADGIHSIHKDYVDHNLNKIFRRIAYTLNALTIIQAAEKDRRDRTFQILCRQRTLLIVDNIDTIQDLDKERDLVLIANLSGNIYYRYWIPIQYHRAEICYNENNYYQANIFFQEVLETEYATKAMTSFELLSMTKEKEEMQVFLNDLQTATGKQQAEENK